MLREKKLACNGRKIPVVFDSLPAIRMNLVSSLAKIWSTNKALLLSLTKHL
jgi:hypothetical protein